MVVVVFCSFRSQCLAWVSFDYGYVLSFCLFLFLFVLLLFFALVARVCVCVCLCVFVCFRKAQSSVIVFVCSSMVCV